MKQGLVFLTMLCLPVPTLAQWITFERTYGGSMTEWGYSALQTADGGYIVAGYTESYGAGFVDFWLVKTDSLGIVEWDTTYGGTNLDDAFSVQQTSDGGYIVAGFTGSYGVGQADFWLVKTDSLGGVEWDTTYGGAYWDGAHSVQQTTDGGYIVAGVTTSFGAGSEDILLVKTDSAGGVEWDTTYGGADWEEPRSVQQTADGGYIVAGYTWSFGAGYSDFWLVKTDFAGGVEWATTYGGMFWEEAYGVEQTTDGGYIVAGYTNSFSAGSRDVWLVKTDSAGVIEWGATYGGAYDDQAYGVQQTTDGGYIIAGSTYRLDAGSDEFWLVKTDSTGVVEWDATYGGLNDDRAENVQQTADGGYLVVGFTASFGAGLYDFYLVKTDPYGAVGVEESRNPVLPVALTLVASPNPFNPATRVSFELPVAGDIRIEAYDVLGRSVAVLHDGALQAGRHEVAWDASGLPSGMYLIRLNAGEQTATTKVVLMK